MSYFSMRAGYELGSLERSEFGKGSRREERADASTHRERRATKKLCQIRPPGGKLKNGRFLRCDFVGVA